MSGMQMTLLGTPKDSAEFNLTAATWLGGNAGWNVADGQGSVTPSNPQVKGLPAIALFDNTDGFSLQIQAPDVTWMNPQVRVEDLVTHFVTFWASSTGTSFGTFTEFLFLGQQGFISGRTYAVVIRPFP